MPALQALRGEVGLHERRRKAPRSSPVLPAERPVSLRARSLSPVSLRPVNLSPVNPLPPPRSPERLRASAQTLSPPRPGFLFHPKALREHSRTRLKVERGGKEPQKASLPGSASLIGKVRRGAMPPRSWRVALPPPRQGGSGSGGTFWGQQRLGEGEDTALGSAAPPSPGGRLGSPRVPAPQLPRGSALRILTGGELCGGGGLPAEPPTSGPGGPPRRAAGALLDARLLSQVSAEAAVPFESPAELLSPCLIRAA